MRGNASAEPFSVWQSSVFRKCFVATFRDWLDSSQSGYGTNFQPRLAPPNDFKIETQSSGKAHIATTKQNAVGNSSFAPAFHMCKHLFVRCSNVRAYQCAQFLLLKIRVNGLTRAHLCRTSRFAAKTLCINAIFDGDSFSLK